jgi:hypothetical protein
MSLYGQTLFYAEAGSRKRYYSADSKRVILEIKGKDKRGGGKAKKREKFLYFTFIKGRL